MKRNLLSMTFAIFVAGGAHIACGPAADYMGTPLEGHYAGADGGSATGTTNTQSSSCDAPQSLPKIDPATLPACAPVCDGAHCVPSADVPSNEQSQLATCSGGYCVPDSMIKSGGAKPASCKSLSGADGVCLSVCVPQVAQYKDLLPQDSCATDERCAPCISPLDQKPTGACDIGTQTAPPQNCSAPATSSQKDPPSDGGAAAATCPHVGPPVVDPTSLPACGGANSGAHCLDPKLVPPSLSSQLATCATGYCVPDKLIAAGGQYIPKTCNSVGGAEGRCTNTVIPKIAAEASLLPQDTCDTDERCAPCYDPFTGADTGACKISCDPGPTKPAVTFAKCCKKQQGHCIPTASVPAAEQKELATDSCTKGQDLCVPDELHDPNFKGKACSATSFLGGSYTGVCLSSCLNFGFAGITLAQGDCDGDHECAPCTNPLTGQPTGAPGCTN